MAQTVIRSTLYATIALSFGPSPAVRFIAGSAPAATALRRAPVPEPEPA